MVFISFPYGTYTMSLQLRIFLGWGLVLLTINEILPEGARLVCLGLGVVVWLAMLTGWRDELETASRNAEERSD
jgi:hypothetical protein